MPSKKKRKKRTKKQKNRNKELMKKKNTTFKFNFSNRNQPSKEFIKMFGDNSYSPTNKDIKHINTTFKFNFSNRKQPSKKFIEMFGDNSHTNKYIKHINKPPIDPYPVNPNQNIDLILDSLKNIMVKEPRTVISGMRIGRLSP